MSIRATIEPAGATVGPRRNGGAEKKRSTKAAVVIHCAFTFKKVCPIFLSKLCTPCLRELRGLYFLGSSGLSELSLLWSAPQGFESTCLTNELAPEGQRNSLRTCLAAGASLAIKTKRVLSNRMSHLFVLSLSRGLNLWEISWLRPTKRRWLWPCQAVASVGGWKAPAP